MMRGRLRALRITTCLSLLALLLARNGAGWSQSPAEPESIQKREPGVVRVRTAVSADFDPDGGESWQTGTGFIFKRDLAENRAFILTVTHVVAGAERIEVLFQSRPNAPFAGEVLRMQGDDPNGLAVILVQNAPDAPVLPIGSLHELLPEESVHTIGFPAAAGDGWRHTPGIAIPDSLAKLKNQIKFKSEIRSGNSGGPLLNRAGTVVGVIGSTQPPFAFALASNRVREILAGWRLAAPPFITQQSISLTEFMDGDLAVFQRPNKGPHKGVATAVRRTQNGEWLVAGTTGPYDYEVRAARIVRFSKNGRVLYDRPIGKKRFIRVSDLAEGASGEIYICGSVSPDADTWTAFVARLSAAGRLNWWKEYPTKTWSSTHRIRRTARKKIVVLGNAGIAGSVISGGRILEIDAHGSLLRDLRVNDGEHPIFFSDFAPTESGFVAVGSRRYLKMFAKTIDQGAIWRLDANARVLKSQYLGDAHQNGLYSLRPTSDGGWLACGSRIKRSRVNGEIKRTGDDAWILRMNADTRLIWDRKHRLGGEQWNHCGEIQELGDGHIIVQGTSSYRLGSEAYVYRGAALARLDAYGDLLWSRTLRRPGIIHSFARANDREFVLAGGLQNFWVLRARITDNSRGGK